MKNRQETRVLAPDLAACSGDDSLTLPMLAPGAEGVIGVASHLAGLPKNPSPIAGFTD